MTHRIRARAARGPRIVPTVETAADKLSAFLEDAAHFPGGHAPGVAFPRSEGEVAALLRTHDSLLPIGAQSSLTGGATPMGEIVVSMARMNHVVEIREETVRVEPGVSLASLQDALEAQNLYYPPVPTFTGATIGGTIATNAAGAATFKYGATRPWIQALTVVLSSGDVLDLTRGGVRAHAEGYFEIDAAAGLSCVPVPPYRMPMVAKRSAGYHAEPHMDLLDLFIGSEGTLGIVTSATLKVIRRTWAPCVAFVPLSSEAGAFALTAALRDAAQTAWRTTSADGVDIPALEYIDRRSFSLVPDRLWRRAGIRPGTDDRAALFVQLELPLTLSLEEAHAQIASFEQHQKTPLGRFCQILARFSAFDRTEIALPGDRRRADLIVELREAVPAAVNEIVGHAKRTLDPSIEKVAGDVIVPFDRLDRMVAGARTAFERRGLDYAIWGHVSDGNLHPNLLPRSAADIQAGKEAILELGRDVTHLGGCPLAEHGVGRNAVKQTLLRQLYGDSSIDAMRAVKRALDPEWKLAPGVLFPKTH